MATYTSIYGTLKYSATRCLGTPCTRWARQAAEALAFVHSCGVLYSDIHCVNFLLNKNLDLKVADFAGASIDGEKSWSFYRTTHQLPDADGKDRPYIKITTLAGGPGRWSLECLLVLGIPEMVSIGPGQAGICAADA